MLRAPEEGGGAREGGADGERDEELHQHQDDCRE